MKETEVSYKLLKGLELLGFIGFKIVASERQQLGVPDILLCYKGRLIFLETKIVPKKYTGAQLVWMNKFKQAGAIVLGVHFDKKLSKFWLDYNFACVPTTPLYSWKGICDEIHRIAKEAQLPE